MEVLPILLCYLLDSFLFNCAFNLGMAECVFLCDPPSSPRSWHITQPSR